MNEFEAMQQRHSVRKFIDKPLAQGTVLALQQEIDAVNAESGFHFQLITDEPEAFQANKPGYGKFQNCKNYLAVTGPKGREIDSGYYGERIVLKAQQLGVNSCWVALSYKKSKAQGQGTDGEKSYLVIALGYGENQGSERKSKTPQQVSNVTSSSPEWFKNGVDSALLAPTAVNQQKFRFELSGDKVIAKAGLGFYTKTDLGIAKYHFELGSGRGKEIWA